MNVQRLTILGVGLLGGSLGLAAKRRFPALRVTGCGHREASLIEAQRTGAVDAWTLDPAAAVRDADLVVLCVPVGVLPAWLERLAPHLPAEAIVTDVGSTKSTVVAAGERLVARFVGSHPMAGGSRTGVGAARADLFDGAACVVTPTPQTDPAAADAVAAFWQALGMRVVRHPPDTHDRLVALVSHLPHAAAAALVAVQSPASLELQGKGYADTTRVAAGDAELWRDIFVDNRANVVDALDGFIDELSRLRTLLVAQDDEAMLLWLKDQAARRSG